MLTTTHLFTLMLAGTLAGCAGMAPLNDATLSSKPVVRYGETAQVPDYVLLYPAGTPLPVNASVTGTLLTEPTQAQLLPKLKRDFYVYQDMASFDGKHWDFSKKILDSKFVITLPGYGPDGRTFDSVSKGSLAAEFNLK
ncbi:hypothetical protein ACMYR3_15105 [Ampullimonas aquatilis]|uniref:hypothetical protein n=1 Tax=Ampullimonas aquatilis TaxID=1341549 RepID=UPI003C7461EF